jgi:cytochrome c-type biogenesis protein CcmH
MVAEVRERLKRGETEEQVRAFFEARYGEWVHMKPKAGGFNLLVWLLPVAVVLGGGALIVLVVRRWIRNAPAAAGGAPTGDVSEEYLRKVRAELARDDLD